VKVGGTIGRTEALGVTLVDTDPLLACVDTVNDRLKVDIEDVTGMGLATEATLALAEGHLGTIDTSTAALAGTVDGSELQVDVVSSALPSGAATESSLATVAGDTTSLDTKITKGVDTDLATVQQVGIYAISNDTSAWGSLHMTNGHNLKVSIEETNGTADLATETTLALAEAHLGTIDTNIASIAGTVDGSELQVDVVSSALPSGAATAAKQPALGTAGTASADVISVQGIASMTALVVDGSGSTQPISASSLPLPSGAATESTLSTMSGKLPSSLDDDRLKIFPAKTWDTSTPISSQVIATEGSHTSSEIDLGINGGSVIKLFVDASSAGTINGELTIGGSHSSGGTLYTSTEYIYSIEEAAVFFTATNLPRYIKINVDNLDVSNSLTVSVHIGQYS
jgi:hypothetical protein